MTTLADLRVSDRAVITVTEAASLLEVDERTVRRACVDGQIPSVRVGARILIQREAFLSLFPPPTAPDAVTPTEPAVPLQLLRKASGS